MSDQSVIKRELSTMEMALIEVIRTLQMMQDVRDNLKAGVEDITRKQVFTEEWYAVRIERLKQWAKAKGDATYNELCSILANGTPNVFEPATYAAILNVKEHENAKLRKEHESLSGLITAIRKLSTNHPRNDVPWTFRDFDSAVEVARAEEERLLWNQVHTILEAAHGR